MDAGSCLEDVNFLVKGFTRLFCAVAASFFFNFNNVNTTTHSSSVLLLSATHGLNGTEQHQRCRLDPPEGRSTGGCCSFHVFESHNQLLPWITPCVPPSRPSDQTHTQDTAKSTDTHRLVWYVHSRSAYPGCLLVRKMARRVSRSSRPAAPSAHPDWFLDRSRMRLSSASVVVLAPRWHSVSRDQRHLPGARPVLETKQKSQIRGTPSFPEWTWATSVRG